MKMPSTPQTPDPVVTSAAQSAANIETARAQGKMANPNVETPYGSQSVSWMNDQPTITQRLSADQQALLTGQNRVQQGLSETAQLGIGTAKDVLGKPLDISGVSPRLGEGDLNQARQQVQDALYNRSKAMLDPQFAQSERDVRTRLANQGFEEGARGPDPNAPGGYAEVMDTFNRGKAGAYADARDRAILAGGAEESRQYGLSDTERNRQISEILMGRSQPLNEITALMSGSQVAQPQFGGFNAPGVGATDYLGAQNLATEAGLNAYNAKAGAASGNTAALAGLAGTGLTAGALYAAMPAAAATAAPAVAMF